MPQRIASSSSISSGRKAWESSSPTTRSQAEPCGVPSGKQRTALRTARSDAMPCVQRLASTTLNPPSSPSHAGYSEASSKSSEALTTWQEGRNSSMLSQSGSRSTTILHPERTPFEMLLESLASTQSSRMPRPSITTRAYPPSLAKTDASLRANLTLRHIVSEQRPDTRSSVVMAPRPRKVEASWRAVTCLPSPYSPQRTTRPSRSRDETSPSTSLYRYMYESPEKSPTISRRPPAAPALCLRFGAFEEEPLGAPGEPGPPVVANT